jgi:mannose-6-phosphate isomerase
MPNLSGFDLYPLRLAALPKEKVWGGTRLAGRFYHGVPADCPVGEVWVLWDQLLVDGGVFRGGTLADLVRAHPRTILGTRLSREPEPLFPLLVKILDTAETLSVQVHPDDHYAQLWEEQPFGKAEVWYILEAEPHSRLIRGVKRPLTRTQAKRAIDSGQLGEALEYVQVAPGDVIMVAPGTIHALGEGILLYELQQASDLTYRLYDWDRRDPGRPLHVEKSLDVAHLKPYARHKIEPIEVPEPGGARKLLCACKYFAAELLTVRTSVTERPGGICFHGLTVLKGVGRLRHGAGSHLRLSSGDSLLVPAGIDEYELQAAEDSEPLVLIKAFVPDLVEDVLLPLRELEISVEAIIQLGGDPEYSDLAGLACGTVRSD